MDEGSNDSESDIEPDRACLVYLRRLYLRRASASSELASPETSSSDSKGERYASLCALRLGARGGEVAAPAAFTARATSPSAATATSPVSISGASTAASRISSSSSSTAGCVMAASAARVSAASMEATASYPPAGREEWCVAVRVTRVSTSAPARGGKAWTEVGRRRGARGGGDARQDAACTRIVADVRFPREDGAE